MSNSTICMPDLSKRPLGLRVERFFPFSAEILFKGWTINLDKWFAAPGTLLLRPAVNEPFFFETVFKAEGSDVTERHPHYGRFLKLKPNELIQLTWLTGSAGTLGAETVVTIELLAQDKGTLLKLSHDGFENKASKENHEQAWPMVLDHMANCLIA